MSIKIFSLYVLPSKALVKVSSLGKEDLLKSGDQLGERDTVRCVYQGQDQQSQLVVLKSWFEQYAVPV